MIKTLILLTTLFLPQAGNVAPSPILPPGTAATQNPTSSGGQPFPSTNTSGASTPSPFGTTGTNSQLIEQIAAQVKHAGRVVDNNKYAFVIQLPPNVNEAFLAQNAMIQEIPVDIRDYVDLVMIQIGEGELKHEPVPDHIKRARDDQKLAKLRLQTNPMTATVNNNSAGGLATIDAYGAGSNTPIVPPKENLLLPPTSPSVPGNGLGSGSNLNAGATGSFPTNSGNANNAARPDGFRSPSGLGNTNSAANPTSLTDRNPALPSLPNRDASQPTPQSTNSQLPPLNTNRSNTPSPAGQYQDPNTYTRYPNTQNDNWVNNPRSDTQGSVNQNPYRNEQAGPSARTAQNNNAGFGEQNSMPQPNASDYGQSDRSNLDRNNFGGQASDNRNRNSYQDTAPNYNNPLGSNLQLPSTSGLSNNQNPGFVAQTGVYPSQPSGFYSGPSVLVVQPPTPAPVATPTSPTDTPVVATDPTEKANLVPPPVDDNGRFLPIITLILLAINIYQFFWMTHVRTRYKEMVISRRNAQLSAHT